MKNMEHKNLYNKLIRTLLNSEFLKRYSMSREMVRGHIDNPLFNQILTNILDNKDFSCRAVLGLFKDILEQLSNGNSPDDWLYYIYQYTLNRSFPNAVEVQFDKRLDDAVNLYLEILRIFTEFEKSFPGTTCQSRYPMHFLTQEEERKFKTLREYKQFKKVFSDNYVYEMMKLAQEVTSHNTLDHICGVHYLALFISRQLYELGLPIDLGKVSGAAAGHDIGKYGCRDSEHKRVPYLHYYYTDLWFKKHDIPYIGHIATNHSTWDLELENLPLESLVLIYSDFRVKNRRNKNNKKEMNIYSLKDSFEIILNKLDNVDEVKEKRYKRVYAKLKDFEDYMISLGVNVDLDIKYTVVEPKKYFSLMQGKKIIENIKYTAIDHNIHLMYKLRDESSLAAILELARSESDWKRLRCYLEIFEEYSTYLTQKQKLITLNFLYELLVHKEEDIRKQAAELIGILIAVFDEEYRKEVPEDVSIQPAEITSYELLDKYIKLFLHPDHKIIDVHKEWIGYNLRVMLASLFSNSKESQKKKYRDVLLKYYESSLSSNEHIKFYLLQAVRYIPYINTKDCSVEKLYNFLLKMLDSEDLEIRLSALDRIYSLLFRISKDSSLVNKLREILCQKISYSNIPAENYLKLKIAKKLSLNNEIIEKYSSLVNRDNEKISDIFLKNLKAATSWISKKINIELLLEHVIKNPKENGLHTAMHYCNLIKVSAIENVRNNAGEALVKMLPFLSMDQRNDVTIELLRALEIEGYHFTKYIPNYLGQVMLYLRPAELDEFIDDFTEKVKEARPQITFLLLRTIGVTVQHYPKYRIFFKEDEIKYKERLSRMLGILLNGLVNYDIQVKQDAFSVIGKDIFGSDELTLEQKNEIFQLIAKKLLTLIPDKDENELLFLNNSASLNHIYRFISDYVFFNGDISIVQSEKVAFFPGTFDPFSLSHKEIAREIRDLGFEVYLAVDEFSWSKRTQPHNLRRKIISMSIADELDIYLYPEDIPINIANPNDLRILKNSFPNSQVFIVVGTDVILNASCYKGEIVESSIHNFPHIIFDRKSQFSTEDDNSKLEKGINMINGKIIRLTLPPQYEDISSTQIRNYIDENRDVSELIDPLAQKFIYEQGAYRREPQYKTIVQTKSLEIQVVDDVDEQLINKLCYEFFNNDSEAILRFNELKEKLNPRIILIRDTNSKRNIIGFSAFHWIRSSMLFNEFKNHHVSEYVRENALGRIIVIDGIFVNRNLKVPKIEQILLTETVAFCLARDYNYAIFRNIIENYSTSSLYEILRLQGFVKIPYGDENNPVYIVNMSNPCTLNLDVESVIKEPFISNENVRKSIQRSRKRLQVALTKLYPGELVLSFDRDMMYNTIIGKICGTNGIPIKQLEPRKLGPYMCVPFGSILKGYIVPNTVTKSMHTEKMFSPNIKSFSIGPYPYYMSLENQIKMLRSFNRPMILVDDLLHKGYRIKVIDPLLKRENIEVKKIIVGILSGRGKELMDIQDREVDSAYFIPNLKIWFNENLLYPFIGGDTVWRDFYPQRNLLSSLNFILPYAYPVFMKGASYSSIYDLSETCIVNAIDILTTLEREYQSINERNLTLNLLGEVFVYPRYPDHGRDVYYDLNLKPSVYLKNDLEHLRRIEDISRK